MPPKPRRVDLQAPLFFATPAEFRRWFEGNHEKLSELWVGFYKRDSGLPSITWPESVDAALCFGWIDGVRKSIDETSYKIRFTPRKTTSKWSGVNIRRFGELKEAGLVHDAGHKAFSRRTAERSEVYAYEQRHTVEFEAAHEKLLRRNKKAWTFFQAQPNWYRRTATWWVVSAKREETREKRLQHLISESEQGQTIRPLTRTKQTGQAKKA